MSFLDKTGLSHFWAQCLKKFATKDAIPSISGLATETYVDNKVASMVDSAPETLNTLNELAAALGDDPNFATTVATEIGGKVNRSGDTMTGELVAESLGIKSGGNYPQLQFWSTDGSTLTGKIQQTVTAGDRRIGFQEYNADQDGVATPYREQYLLPAPNAGLTANKTYSILTSKDLVTIAQGGTGATTAKGALTNLGALPLSGGTLTGALTLPGNLYAEGTTLDATQYAINMKNSNIVGVNGIYMNDAADGITEGLHFYRSATTYDSLWAASGKLYFTPNRPLSGAGTAYTVYHTGNKPTAADIGAAPDSHTHQNLVKTSSNYSGSLTAGFADQSGLIGWDIEGNYSSDDDTVIALSLRINKENGNIQARTDSKVGTKYPVFYTTINKPTASDVGALPLNPASIEMYAGASANHGGFIDFHYNGSTSDHTSRIIESASSVLDINNVSGGKVRLGTVTAGTWNGSAIPVAYGGTGATTAAAARTNLGITPGNIGAIPTSRTVNGKALSANITLSAADVGAIPTTQAIAANTDLNTITTPGFYYCAANSTVATLTNAPSGNAFYMEVGKHAGVYQRVIEYLATGGAKIYIRNYYSNTWTAWGREYTTWNKPTASELSVLPLSGGTLTGLLTGTRAHFTSTTDASETSQDNVALRLGAATGLHIDIDNNEIIAKSDATTVGLLYLNSSGTVHLGTVTSNLTCTGTITGAKVIGAVYA